MTTRQEFVESVKGFVVERLARDGQPVLSGLVSLVPIEYRFQPDEPQDLMDELLGVKMWGETKVVSGPGDIPIPGPIQIFGNEPETYLLQVAYNVVHEVAHVLTFNQEDEHGELWARACTMLGFAMFPYEEGPVAISIMALARTEGMWNPDLYSKIKALPVPVSEWGEPVEW